MVPSYQSVIAQLYYIKFIMSSQQAELLLEALSKKYEKRTYQEHRTVTDAIAHFFPTLTPKKVKLLSFFLQLKLPPTQLYPESTHPATQTTRPTPSSSRFPAQPTLSFPGSACRS
jgi:hypothetical protein